MPPKKKVPKLDKTQSTLPFTTVGKEKGGGESDTIATEGEGQEKNVASTSSATKSTSTRFFFYKNQQNFAEAQLFLILR